MIFLGIGTNIGEKGQNLREALIRLSKAGVEIKRCSSVFETPPWGIEEQDSFYNLVAEVGFENAPLELLDICLRVENEMGRKRTVKWGPRLIDIDILEFHRKIIHSERLSLPHPYYTQRDFVLVPLAELEPQWRPTIFLRGLDQLLEPRNFQEIKRVGSIQISS